MAGTTSELEGHALKIRGYYDHVHLLLRFPAKIAGSSFGGQLKACTSKQVNESIRGPFKVGWQDGFGAFTVSVSQKDCVMRYIDKQTIHHSPRTFEEEYIHLLNKHEVEYDPKYVFD